MRNNLKRVIACLLIACLLTCSNQTLLTSISFADNIKSNEIPQGYTPIYTKQDLDNVRNDLNGNYILMNDIEFTKEDFLENGDFYNNNEGFEPIGNGSSTNIFKGIFDGNGYSIKNLKIRKTSSEVPYIGLFGYNKGTIKNLHMVNSDIYISVTSSSIYGHYIGGIVGFNCGGNIINCTSSGNLYGESPTTKHGISIGGIIGCNEYSSESKSNIINCINYSNVSVYSPKGSADAGGIASRLEAGQIKNCVNYGSVSAKCSTNNSADYAGGIAAYSNTDILNCYNAGNISSNYIAGGISASNTATIKESYNLASISGGHSTGGIVGFNYNRGNVIDCYNKGNINGNYYVGGISGINYELIKNSYNIGFTNIASITLNTSIYGNNYGKIENCYSIKNEYSIEQDNVTNLPLSEMRKKESYKNFDFDNIWDIGNELPYLKALGNKNSFINDFSTSDEISLLTGENKKIKINTNSNTDYSTTNFTFESLNKNIATVKLDKTIVGVNKGSTKIIITENFTGISKTINVNVTQGPSSIEIVGNSKVSLGNTTQLSINHLPQETALPDITWSTSDANIATINENGLVTGISTGTVTINAKTSNNLKSTFELTVIKPADNVNLIEDNINLKINNGKSLQYKLTPDDSSIEDITWTSSDEDIVSVDENGYIYGKKLGKATITAKLSNNKFDTCEVTVYMPIDNIEFEKNDIKLAKCYTQKMNLIISPTDATYKDFIWTSSNPNIATVDDQGIVRGISLGNSIITATSKVDNHLIKAVVEVGTGVENITLDKSKISLNKNDSYTLTASLTPSNALSQDIKWSSSNNDVATVDENGKINAIGIGNAIITATSTDGTNKKATCIVNVTSKLQSINFETSEVVINSNDNFINLQVYTNPVDTTDKFELEYKSSDESVAKVDKNGKVTPVSGGSVTITASIKGTNLQDNCKVTVYRNIGKATIEPVSDCTYTGNKFMPKPIVKFGNKVLKENQDYKLEYFSNINPGIASIRILGIGYYNELNFVDFTIKLPKLTNLKVEYKNKSNILTWNSVKGATGYKIFRATSKNGKYTEISNNPSIGTNTSYTDKSNLESGKTYYYKVRAISNNYENNEYSDIVSVTIPVSKTRISSIVSKSYNSIELKWDKVSDSSGYVVYRSTDKDKGYKSVATIVSSSNVKYIDSSLTTGTTYYYKIRAYKNINGKQIFSSHSDYKSIKPIPTAPSSITAKSNSYNSNKITWNKTSGASGYVIYRATSKNGKYTALKTISDSKITTYTNSSLNTGTTYYYKIKAYRTVGKNKIYSNYSSVVSAKPKLSTPSITLSTSSKKATIKWKKVSGASGYELYRATSKNGKYTKIATLKNSVTSYTNSKLTSKKTYYFKLRTYRTVNGKKVYSSYSSIKNIKIK